MPRAKTAPLPETPSLPSPKSPGKTGKTSGNATFPVARISRRAADRLRASHVWVYRTDIETLLPPGGSDDVAPGSLISVQDYRGAPLGTALYSSASMIALRLISSEEILTRPAFLALIQERLRQAFRLRSQLLENTSGTNACRLVFSEADALPGILIDRYGELVILQLLTQATHTDDVRATVVSAIREAFDPSSIACIVERPDPRICELEQLGPSPSEPLYMRTPAQPLRQTFFQLNGLRFLYDADAGQKTGAFLDQRENYAAAASYAHGRALDICTYQGGFALHLARVCPQVTGVDSSRVALEAAERNLVENQKLLMDNGRSLDWIEANAFDLLRDWSDIGERFDTIVLDPPAFAKSKRATEGALRGYKEMNLRALKMLQPGGTLITCSCSHHVSLADFTAVIAAAAVDAGRRVRLLEMRGAALDHPAILTIPETQYLKCLICSVE